MHVKIAKLSSPPEEPVYCIATATRGDGLRFLTKARAGCSWYENILLPAPASLKSNGSAEVEFQLMEKAQFGSDKHIGSAKCCVESFSVDPKALDIAVVGNEGLKIGALSVDVSLA